MHVDCGLLFNNLLVSGGKIWKYLKACGITENSVKGNKIYKYMLLASQPILS
jgi:hypothetical protein